MIMIDCLVDLGLIVAPEVTAVFPDNLGGRAICIDVGQKRATAAQTADEPSQET